METRNEPIFDALYGEITFRPELDSLIQVPAVQRLRDIRLSNIDSISLPGIANISRYEHAIGTAHLASQIGFSHRLLPEDSLILQAAALLHDSAITPMGHLIEEALAYLDKTFDHEQKWSIVFNQPSKWDLGGIEHQLEGGREAGLLPWAKRNFGSNSQQCLYKIIENIRGEGQFGRCIAGDIDLDNLDNLTRIAYHMGLEVDRDLAIKISRGMNDIREDGNIVFNMGIVDQIEAWLNLRQRVYQRLMLSRRDFSGKIMIISAVVRAFKQEHKDLGVPENAWKLNDRQFFQRLLNSPDRQISETIDRWLNHKLWALSDLLWMKGEAPPPYRKIMEFSLLISKELNRPCFAYRIKDKRNRRIKFFLENGAEVVLGAIPKQWVLGVGSQLQKDFTLAEDKIIRGLAIEFFMTPCLSKVDTSTPETANLFD